MTDDDSALLCTDCGQPRSAHETDPRTLEPTTCPVAPGDQGHTVDVSELMRERQNMKRAGTDIDGPVCAHQYGEPHEAEYEQREDGRWIAVCQRHVDPTCEVRPLHAQDT